MEDWIYAYQILLGTYQVHHTGYSNKYYFKNISVLNFKKVLEGTVYGFIVYEDILFFSIFFKQFLSLL